MLSHPSHRSLSREDCILDLLFDQLEVLLLLVAGAFAVAFLRDRAESSEDLEDLLKLGVVDHRFGLDVDYSFACLRIVDLSVADSELSKAAKGCLKDFN